MKRPIGVTLLAVGAGLLALFEIWRTLVFLGIVNWTFLGKEVSFPDGPMGAGDLGDHPGRHLDLHR